MPTALMCTLRPTAVACVQASLGRAAHAAILEHIAAADPLLTNRLHREQDTKPLRVSNVRGLEGRGGRARVPPACTYGLRLPLLCDTLEAVARPWTPDPFGPLMWGGVEGGVERITADTAEHPWAG